MASQCKGTNIGICTGKNIVSLLINSINNWLINKFWDSKYKIFRTKLKEHEKLNDSIVWIKSKLLKGYWGPSNGKQ